MSNYILAIDQGTTGTTVALVNQDGEIKARRTEEFPQVFPKPGWVEHNPAEIWRSVLNGIEFVISSAGISRAAIAGIGITNQRETVLAWDQTQTLYNAIVWQCRRTTEVCERLKRRGFEKSVRKATGLLLDPYFSASKIQWLIENVEAVRKAAKLGNLRFGTVDSFLIWQLSGGKSHVTDVSNASRTLLMNIENLSWEPDLLKLFKVPKAALPTIAPSSGTLAVTHGVPGLPDGIPIAGVAGDQQSALFGQIGFERGAAKCTFGTGSFLLMNAGSKRVHSRSGLLTTVAWQLPKQKVTYALEGGAFICGAAVQFLRDGFGFFAKSSEIEALAAQVDDSGGVEFVPALAGLGAPYWQPRARGAMLGLTRGTTRAHIARATLEALALQNADIFHAMEKDLGSRLKSVKVDGGAAQDNLLMQLQSDYLNMIVIRPKQTETTVLGAAFLAGLGVGLWPSTESLKKIWQTDQVFEPRISAKQRAERLKRWHHAIAQVTYKI